jgi:phosphoribosylaminoimidazole-succinocarboxamide synthase
MDVVTNTQCEDLLVLINRGKVRDVYAIPDHQDKLLIVATDRISAYDHIIPDPIPGKGRILTRMSAFWLDFFADIPHHMISTDVATYPEICQRYSELLRGRSMLVKRCRVLPVECIVRGRMTGSYWSAYQKAPYTTTESQFVSFKEVCGIRFPTGMQESEAFPVPLFTPSTKAAHGDHDENISITQLEERIGPTHAQQVAQLSIDLFTRAAAYAEKRGIVIADTKFEFGLDDEDRVIVIDEVLTPDSSRFWPAESVTIGTTPPSFDKQFLRDYLRATGWDKRSPPPHIPPDIIAKTQECYITAEKMLLS